MNEDMLKKIVSVFIKKAPNTIGAETIIDNSVIQGSVLFHRMISRINDFYKIEIDNYENIVSYETLLKIIKEKLETNDKNRD